MCDLRLKLKRAVQSVSVNCSSADGNLTEASVPRCESQTYQCIFQVKVQLQFSRLESNFQATFKCIFHVMFRCVFHVTSKLMFPLTFKCLFDATSKDEFQVILQCMIHATSKGKFQATFKYMSQVTSKCMSQ